MECKGTRTKFSPFWWWVGFCVLHWLGHGCATSASANSFCLWRWMLTWVNF